IFDLMMFANKYSIILRFIELMPMKEKKNNNTYTKQTVFHIARQYGLKLLPTNQKFGNGPAHYYQMDQTYIGFIEPIHGKFCHSCNRIRLTSSGFLKGCLFHQTGYDLKKVISNEALLKKTMQDVIYHKPLSHEFETKSAGFGMNEIGG
ncbi:MAG: cyclic pyranopterin phosphate synthase MoaA, partial [Faecalibacillus sp.]